MEKKGNITLRTMNNRRKKVLYNVNVHLKNRVVKRTIGSGNRGTRRKELPYSLFTGMIGLR